jgi:asparagine synthase (glutamine-hydrolysing)
MASVLGDFVLARGPTTGEWVRGLDGFTPITAPGDAVQVAVRGDAQHGPGWAALADLIAGRPDDGAPAARRGRFAQIAWDPKQASAVSDHFSTLSVYVLAPGDLFLVASDLRILAASPFSRRELDPEGIYHYFNFAQIPAPLTVFRDIRRLPPATRVTWKDGRIAEERYHIPEYAQDLRGSDAALAGELRERIVATVQAYRPSGAGVDGAWGCFLSGGTDSSSIVSILAQQRRGPVKSFSIGFAEQGYDELGYARLAASACGAEPAFHSVSREEAQALVVRVIEGYDQPFGNASAIPTIACADLAHASKVSLLLAGDGGDEIFGGNERYAKDQIMEAWYAMPAPVRAVGRRVGGMVGGSKVHLLNRVENFFERASLPNPDRFYTDDSFASDHYDEMLSPDFRKQVARDASLDFMRGVYKLGASGGPLHRIMRLDLMMAIAQNDLRKVHGATRSAGVSVRFPYLDPELVAWTGRLPERYKVRRLTKRYLFRLAMRDIRPVEIIKKKKQGFGLPIAVWLRSDKAFQTMVRDTIFDARARARGYWQPAFVERLLAEHEQGAWDHADSIWRLFVLERWLRRYADG